MGYYIRELKNKKQSPHWKVQFITYKKEDTKSSNAQKPRKEWDLPLRRWNALGFKDTMTLEQARSRTKQINAQIEIKRQESRHLVFEAYGRGNLKGGLVIIDEPEIHLHYQFQHEYLRVIEEINKDQKCQYVLVTHSESLINSTTIHSIKRFSLNSENNTVIMSPILNTDQRILIKILDNTRATYSFFGKKVVLVEGDTDRYFFKALLNEINPSLAQEISVLDIGGKGGFESWSNFFSSFGLKVYFIGDFDNVYSLEINGQKIIETDQRLNIECELKQEKLNNLTLEQQNSLKESAGPLFADQEATTKPKRELWKPVVDKFIFLSKLESGELVKKIRATNANIDTEIEKLYSNNVYILKRGDLESYLNLESKGLPGVIHFCNNKLSEWVQSNTADTLEIKNILNQIMGS